MTLREQSYVPIVKCNIITSFSLFSVCIQFTSSAHNQWTTYKFRKSNLRNTCIQSIHFIFYQTIIDKQSCVQLCLQRYDCWIENKKYWLNTCIHVSLEPNIHLKLSVYNFGSRQKQSQIDTRVTTFINCQLARQTTIRFHIDNSENKFGPIPITEVS